MEGKKTRNARMVPLALIGVLLAVQSNATETPAGKRARELQQRLAKSEAQAASLQQRVERLERRLETLGTPITGAVEMPVAQASPPPATAQAPAVRSHTPQQRSAPGTFAVDEEAAQRALERTLTQSGALLLPPRTVEVTPGFTYRRTEQTTQTLATIIPSGSATPVTVLANQRNRRNENSVRLDLRAGMPYNTQLEASLPYNYIRSSQVSDLGTSTSADSDDIGDITLGVAKTLTREKGWQPDLIGRLTYNTGSGKRQNNGITLSGGYRQAQAELVAIKRQDPLAFVASVFHAKTFEKDAIKPGDATGFSLAAVLAASPATSLQLGFSQIYRREQEFNGVKIPGSSQTYGIVNLGASSVLSRDMTLVTQVGIGLGNDAPKYSFTVALPILFR